MIKIERTPNNMIVDCRSHVIQIKGNLYGLQLNHDKVRDGLTTRQ